MNYNWRRQKMGKREWKKVTQKSQYKTVFLF